MNKNHRNKKESKAPRKNRVRDQIEVMDFDDRRTESGAKRSSRRASMPGTRSRKSGRNLEFLIITYLFLAIFLGLVAYFIYFQTFKSESLISSPYNTRQDLYAERVVRGDILSADGKVLATTETDKNGDEHRVYPYKRMFAHVVGYFNNGKGGLESQYNFNLLRSHAFFLTQIINDLRDKKNPGDTVVTTLDYDVQKAAYDALGNRNGAVVALEAKTGKVLAMVSRPDFDPNTLAKKWDQIVSDEDSSVLLNRATSGLYPPGSTFKIFTTLEYVHENSDYAEYSFDCKGKLSVEGNEIHCYQNAVHGEEDLADSFANSCNTSYSTIGLSLDISKFRELCSDMLFNHALPGRVAGAKSSFTLDGDDSAGKVMQTAIGQGDTQVTPLHMALIAGAIANNGEMMEPYLVDRIERDGGSTVRRYRSASYGTLISRSDAKLLQKFMKGVVKEGTAQALKGQSYDAAGKTGSAEYNEARDSHGWFVGYASQKGKEDIALAVIVEDGGSGSRSAVPVAKKVFDAYFSH